MIMGSHLHKICGKEVGKSVLKMAARRCTVSALFLKKKMVVFKYLPVGRGLNEKW